SEPLPPRKNRADTLDVARVAQRRTVDHGASYATGLSSALLNKRPSGRCPGRLPMSCSQSQNRAILLLALAAFVSSSAFRICDPMLPQLATEFGASTGQAGATVTAFAVAYGLLQMFFGPVGDRYGKFRVVAIATCACAMGSAGAVFAPSLDVLIVCRVLSGAAGAGIVPLSMAWIGDNVAYEQRQATLARFLTGT